MKLARECVKCPVAVGCVSFREMSVNLACSKRDYTASIVPIVEQKEAVTDADICAAPVKFDVGNRLG